MFENLENAIEQSIIKQVSEAKLVNVPFSGLIKIPESFINDAWNRVDKDSLLEKLSARIEDELVDRIVNHMAQEIATDIKQVLSVKERREAIRSVCRDNLDEICGRK